MNEQNKSERTSTQPDKDKAANERPIPSQAEGDRETVEEDLREKSGSGQSKKS